LEVDRGREEEQVEMEMGWPGLRVRGKKEQQKVAKEIERKK
jgi:hypothetical protein